jgi:hypothetical protein
MIFGIRLTMEPRLVPIPLVTTTVIDSAFSNFIYQAKMNTTLSYLLRAS